MAEPEENQEQLIWRHIKACDTAMLVTTGADGTFDARPMGCVQPEFDGELWFLASRRSPKLREIAGDWRVMVIYVQSGKHEYVTLNGKAREVDDPEKKRELWTEIARLWFPKGVEDPDLTIIAIEVDHAKAWLSWSSSVVSYGAAYLKSRLTGRKPAPSDLGEVKEFEL